MIQDSTDIALDVSSYNCSKFGYEDIKDIMFVDDNKEPMSRLLKEVNELRLRLEEIINEKKCKTGSNHETDL